MSFCRAAGGSFARTLAYARSSGWALVVWKVWIRGCRGSAPSSTASRSAWAHALVRAPPPTCTTMWSSAPPCGRAHLPAVQADPGLDRPEGPQPPDRRPVDLARHRRPHPAPPRPPTRRRPPPPLGTTTTGEQTHARTSPPRVPQPPPDHTTSSQCAQTIKARPRTPTWLQKPRTGTPPRRRKDREARTHTRSPPRRRRINVKLRSR